MQIKHHHRRALPPSPPLFPSSPSHKLNGSVSPLTSLHPAQKTQSDANSKQRTTAWLAGVTIAAHRPATGSKCPPKPRLCGC